MKKAVLALAALIATLPGQAFAGGLAGTVPIGDITIEGGKIIITNASFLNPDSCSATGYIVVAADDPDRDRWLSLVLTAKAMERPVLFWVSGCTASPWSASAPRVESATMK
jgi:hypothetical protein